MLIKITSLDNGRVDYTNNFYFFEERGIREINDEGIGKDFVGREFKIEFVKEDTNESISL